jgi:Guanine nucleotide exchange factor synembryn
MNRGMFSGLPSQSSPQFGVGEDVDPITGQIKKETKNPFDGMTDEEKERESEKLFVLFDKLNKTGVFQPINPFNLENK